MHSFNNGYFGLMLNGWIIVGAPLAGARIGIKPIPTGDIIENSFDKKLWESSGITPSPTGDIEKIHLIKKLWDSSDVRAPLAGAQIDIKRA